jgi:hypothetical protein
MKERNKIILVVAILLASILLIGSTMFSIFPSAPEAIIKSPKSFDQNGYVSKSDNVYDFYIMLSIDFEDNNGNMSRVKASYSFEESGTFITYVDMMLNTSASIYGYSYTSTVIFTVTKPAELPDYYYLYLLTKITDINGDVVDQSFVAPFQVDFDSSLHPDQVDTLTGLIDIPVIVINPNPPTGLGAIISWEFVLLIPIVFTIIVSRRRGRENEHKKI